jgi:hypothetical protein
MAVFIGAISDGRVTKISKLKIGDIFRKVNGKKEYVYKLWQSENLFSILVGETIKDGDFPILLGMISQVTMKPKATSM